MKRNIIVCICLILICIVFVAARSLNKTYRYPTADKDNFKKLQEEQKAARTYQEELFDEYLGTWRAYNGNTIRFYIDDNGERRVSITDTIDNPFIKFEDSVPEGYTARIALDAYTCGMQYGFDICVDGDQMTTSVTGDRIFYKEVDKCNLRPELKPVIYLYPTEDNTKISVRMDYDGIFIELDPAFNIDNGWNVTADKNGTIHLNDDKYDYLFWEGIPNATYHIDEGFCVKGEDTKDFLEQSLKTLGLNEKEVDEFTDFWVPKMKDNTYNVICFQTTQYTDHSYLLVTPQPDSMIRVFMSWYGCDEYVEIEPQSLQASERTGFTVVEWGGSEIK